MVNSNKKVKILVHTSIIGDRSRDKLIHNQYKCPNIDYVCFTNRNIKSPIWQVHNVKPHINGDYSDRKSSRLYKMQGYKFYPTYDYYVWVDAQVTITKDIINFVTSNLEKSDIIFTKHHNRNCIYDEIKVIRSLFKEYDICDDIVKRLKQDGMPKNNGLIAGNRFIYPNRDKAKEFMDLWYKEYTELGSCRDQASANYCLWKTGMRVKYFTYGEMVNNGFKR